MIYIGKCPCARSQLLNDLSNGKCLFCDVSACSGLDYNYYPVSIRDVRKRQKKTSALSSSRFIRRVKMSALASLHVVIHLSMEDGVLYVTRSVSYSDIGKCLSFAAIPISDQTDV